MNSKDFLKDVTEIQIEPNEDLCSYDNVSFVPSVDKALEVIGEKLGEDQTLRDRTPLVPDDIIRLLSLCLRCKYFLFQREYYL